MLLSQGWGLSLLSLFWGRPVTVTVLWIAAAMGANVV